MPTAPPYRVLIVDDSEEDRALYRRVLQKDPGHRYAFEETDSMEAGAARCAEAPPHCVLLDFNLPDGDGLELIGRLPRVRDRLPVPVVMLTGQGNEAVAVAAMKAGAKDYLIKAVLTPEALRRAVGNAVEKGLLESRLELQRRRLKAVNRDLARKNRDIQSFYHVVSHELKTPLTVIREFAGILADGLAGPVPPEQRAHLELILDHCGHMAAMINDLLDVTRLEGGGFAIHPEATDLAALAARVVHGMGPAAEARGVALDLDAPPGLPPARADPGRIRQVLDNLVVNALKFTPAGGRVRVSVTAAQPAPGAPAPHLAVAVADTGVGIPADQIERIFERFYQVNGDAVAREGGLGLGLTLCRGLVGLHGGEITVTSEPGRGSVFRFTLARAEPLTRLGTEPGTEP